MKAAYVNSNFSALEGKMWTMIAQRRGDVMLRPYLTAARNEILKLEDNVAAQYQLLGADRRKANQLMEELKKKSEELELLQDAGSDWRSQLALLFAKLQTDMGAEQRMLTDKAIQLVDDEIAAQGTKICKTENYTSLIGDINSLIGGGIVDIRQEIEMRLEATAADIEAHMPFSIHINEDLLDKIGFTPQENLQVRFAPKKTMDTIIRKGTEISRSLAGGSRVGMILGGAVAAIFLGPSIASAAAVSLAVGAITAAGAGATVGAAAGGLVGGAKGCVDALNKYDNLDAGTINKTLRQYISASMTSVNRSLSNTVAELRTTVTSSFEQRLRQKGKELKENAAQIQKNINLAANEIPKRQTVLESQHRYIQEFLQRYADLELAIDDLCLSVPALKQVTPETELTPKQLEEKPAGEEVTYGFL